MLLHLQKWTTTIFASLPPLKECHLGVRACVLCVVCVDKRTQWGNLNVFVFLSYPEAIANEQNGYNVYVATCVAAPPYM